MSRPASVVSTPTQASLHEVEKVGVEEPQQRPFSHRWNDPAIASNKALFIKAMVGTTVITSIAVLAMLSIYWGAFWKTPDLVHHLGVEIVDFDGGAIGQLVRQVLTSPAFTGAHQQLTFTVAEAGEYATTQDVRNAVVNEDYWSAVVIPHGASEALQTAIATADASYNATNAIVFFTNTARNENTGPRFIMPVLNRALETVSQRYAAMQAPQLASAGNLQTLLTTAPQLVTRPVSFHLEELRPFDVPVGAAVDFVGLIYMLVIAFIMAMVNYNIRIMTGLDNLLTLHDLLIVRWVVPFLYYFPLSWVYSFVSLAFQVDFTRYYGGGGFMIYWCSCFCGMASMGLALESLLTLFTPRFIPYFLLCWIICNIGIAFYPLVLLPSVYSFGYAMPFLNISQIVRTIVFDSKNRMAMNFGILLAWIALSCITMPLIQIFMRRREQRAHEAEQQKKMV